MKPSQAICRSILILFTLVTAAQLLAQVEQKNLRDPARQDASQATITPEENACIERPLKDDRQREEQAISNLPSYARFWLTEDVVYLISPAERRAFLDLTTDQQRNQFIEQFWSMRSPDPRSLDNGFKEEHYRRIVFANEKYGARLPGWKTDRGRLYITFGPPDSIESQRGGQKSSEALGETANTVQYSSEKWHYNYVKGVGENVDLTFVDSTGNGDYRFTMSPTEKNDWLFVPRRNRDCSSPPRAPEAAQRFDVYVGVVPTPLIHFKDLEAMAISRIIRDQLTFNYRIAFVKATHATTITKIIILVENKQLVSSENAVKGLAELQIFARIAKPSGWVTDVFEGRILFDAPQTEAQDKSSVEFDAVTAPGVYRLAIVLKDTASGKTASRYASIVVPPYEHLGAKK